MAHEHAGAAGVRQVEQVVTGTPGSDGAGVRLTRVLTHAWQRRLDPFLMLDAFGSDDPDDYVAGFPDHPHRGFETVTYMLAGSIRHRDSAGHEGRVDGGGVQWMTAGRGVIHSEMPEQREGRMEGFQLWLNLPSHDKMREPWYRDITAAELPQIERAGATAIVIAGDSHGVSGVVQRATTEPLIVDLHLAADAAFEQPLPATHNAFIYVYRGAMRVGDTEVPAGRMAILGNDGARAALQAAGGAPARALLVAGRPLGEPIVQYGPFVMNSEAQIRAAIDDFRAGRLA